MGELLSPLLKDVPETSRRLLVLDVGCGDGLITDFVAQGNPRCELRGIDVRVRNTTGVPVDAYEGGRLPFADDAFDVVMFIDAIHHARDPVALLSEGARVAARAILVKDHKLVGPLAGPTLAAMDRISNLRHRIGLPYEYWTPERWERAFADLGLRVEEWRERLELYPWWSRFVFERQLHFAARLGVPGGPAS